MNDNLVEYRLDALEKTVTKLEAELAQIEHAEKQKLKWGISVLGGALLTVVGVVWSYRAIIFRG